MNIILELFIKNIKVLLGMKFLIKQFQELMKFLEGGEIMSEFKAQLLGILIVIGVFSAIVVGYKTLVDNTWDKIDQEMSSLSISTTE